MYKHKLKQIKVYYKPRGAGFSSPFAHSGYETLHYTCMKCDKIFISCNSLETSYPCTLSDDEYSVKEIIE